MRKAGSVATAAVLLALAFWLILHGHKFLGLASAALAALLLLETFPGPRSPIRQTP